MTESPRFRLAVLAAIPVALVSLVWLVSATRDRIPPPGSILEISGPAPLLAGETLGGDILEPAEYRGRVVVVNFWASWCGPCRREQPGLQRLHQEYADRVAFVGVNFKDDPAAARTYLDEFGVTYPSVTDPDGRLAYEFRLPYIPATVVVDRSGEMRYLMLGAQPEAALREHIERLLRPA